MTIEARTTVKSYFETGDKPTQAQFANFIDSTLFYEDTSDFGRSLVSASAAASARGLLGSGSIGDKLFVAITTASVQNQIGGGAVGKALFEAVTTASGQNQLGGGAVGKNVFEAITTASAVANLGLTNFANPVGAIIFYPVNTPPIGYLECNGAAISRSIFADLFALIGIAFGSGNGSTTFNIPDIRGYFPRGWDHGRGVDSGRAFGSNQADAFQGHWHQNDPNADGGAEGATGGGNTVNGLNITTFAKTIITDGANGAPRIAAETRPVNIALMFCIKY